MSNFLILIDPDLDRKRQFLATVEPLLPPIEGLTITSCDRGEFAAIWAAHPKAPISWTADEQSAAIIWGTAFMPERSYHLQVSELAHYWSKAHPSEYPAFDGYYVALTYHPQTGLTLGADILGTYPVYYYTSQEITLVGSSPELFRHHPCVQTDFNPAGLVGVLLTNGLANNETLLKNIRRLDAGHLLIHSLGQWPQEIQHYSIPEGKHCEAYSQLSFADQIDLLETTLDQAITQQTTESSRYGLLLSGGLDSRTLAGFLRRQQVPVTALTLGHEADLEVICARAVTQQLGFSHQFAEITRQDYITHSLLSPRWEHLAGGFSFTAGWGVNQYLRPVSHRVMAGYSLDLVLGGPAPDRLFLNPLSFDTFFAKGVQAWGFTPDILTRLLNPQVFGGLVHATLDKLQFKYDNYADTTFRRALRFKLHHRQRFHVGMSAWRMSFSAWPVLPYLNQQLLEVSASIPAATLDSRNAQKALLCKAFPELAQLPLDRNDYSIQPLQAAESADPMQTLQQQWRRIQAKAGYERRFYYRTLDINNPGWRAIRQQADSLRPFAEHLFNPEQLNLLLPATHHTLRSSNPIAGNAPLRNLWGFFLWAAHHLS
jgi:asparagine synthase (glutamine-hydrolysing)